MPHTTQEDLKALEQFVRLAEIKTGWRKMSDGIRGWPNHECRATYGFDVPFARRTNQQPCFHAICDIRDERLRDAGGGAAHDIIAAVFPEIAYALRWHLASWPGLPMHYIENAVYWFSQITEISEWERNERVDAYHAFRSTIVSGVCADDEQRLLEFVPMYGGPWESVEVKRLLYADARKVMGTNFDSWLQQRIPALRAAFVTDMVTLGVAQFIGDGPRIDPENPLPVDAELIPTCVGCDRSVSETCDICGCGRCCTTGPFVKEVSEETGLLVTHCADCG